MVTLTNQERNPSFVGVTILPASVCSTIHPTTHILEWERISVSKSNADVKRETKDPWIWSVSLPLISIPTHKELKAETPQASEGTPTQQVHRLLDVTSAFCPDSSWKKFKVLLICVMWQLFLQYEPWHVPKVVSEDWKLKTPADHTAWKAFKYYKEMSFQILMSQSRNCRAT